MKWIVGPCSMETEKLYLETAAALHEIMEGRDWYYKASFDKANRTSVNSRRGPGLDAALPMFEKAKKLFPGIRLTTDVHEVHQVERLKGLIDVVQVPAFLCRQTNLLVECGRCFGTVNVKKGQWMAPGDTERFSEKTKGDVWITERGTCCGPDRLYVDFDAVRTMQNYGMVFLDCTHSTNNSRSLARRYVVAAPIFGYSGIFAEVHQNPDKAYSDMYSQMRLRDWARLVEQVDAVENVVGQ